MMIDAIIKLIKSLEKKASEEGAKANRSRSTKSLDAHEAKRAAYLEVAHELRKIAGDHK